MLRLPSLTFQISNSFPSISSTLQRTTRAGLAHTRTHHHSISARRLATMSTQSKACCTVPPVVSEGYKEKGEWITINGMKTYATGPKDAKSALLVVYDIFGFFPQTLQGADILAHSDKDHQYQVFMPGKLLATHMCEHAVQNVRFEQATLVWCGRAGISSAIIMSEPLSLTYNVVA